MSKEYFSVSCAKPLSEIPKGAKIHIVGVCGVAMAQLACELASKGFNVSGSDVEFYEPMGSLLRSSSVRLMQGYEAQHISSDIEIGIIGNAISYGNAEVLEIERKGIPYSLFPKVLHELVIDGKHSIVVTGTHGKTTTTAMCASVLSKAGLCPGYFLGGIAVDLPFSLSSGSGSFSVVEGDEYDSAFFAKTPKFHFYKPDTLIVTSVEYDHADIYPDLASIEKEFSELVLSLPQDAQALVCADNEHMLSLVEQWKQSAQCRILTYGTKESDFSILERKPLSDAQLVTVLDNNGRQYEIKLLLSGAYNAKNALGVFAALSLSGISPEIIKSGFSQFHGVLRRQQLRIENDSIVFIEDFAHHPTAVLETLLGIKERFPGRRLVCIFEPRSNTSRRKIFQESYCKSLSLADVVILSDVVVRHNDGGLELMNVGAICDSLAKSGVEAQAVSGYENVKSALVARVKEGDVVVAMSNGSFGGIIPEIEAKLKESFGLN